MSFTIGLLLCLAVSFVESIVFNALGMLVGRGVHSFRFQLNLSSSVHRVTQLN